MTISEYEFFGTETAPSSQQPIIESKDAETNERKS